MAQNTPILVISINLAPEKTETLEVFLQDVPEEVAARFAQRHGLTTRAQNLLLQQIQIEIQKAAKEQKNAPKARSALFNTLLKKTAQEEAPPKVTPRETPIIKNSGERLYVDGVNWKKKVIREREHLRAKKEEDEGRFSFRPSINPHSEVLAKQIENKDHKRFLEKERCVDEQREREVRGCTFSPEINNRSKNIQSPDRFEQLYEEAKVRKARHQALKEHFVKNEFSFRPETNGGSSESHKEVLERLTKSKIYTDLESKRERSELNQLVDPNTGQEYFKPLINNYAGKDWSKQGTHIKYCTQVHDFSYTPEELLGKSRSDKILGEAKEKSFFSIFTILSNGQDLLTPRVMHTEKLDKEVFQLIQPLVLQIQDFKQRINYTQFAIGMENLMKLLTPPERKTVLFKKKRVEETEDDLCKTQFKLKNNLRKSEEVNLKDSGKRAEDGKYLYTINENSTNRSFTRINKEREELAKRELLESRYQANTQKNIKS